MIAQRTQEVEEWKTKVDDLRKGTSEQGGNGAFPEGCPNSSSSQSQPSDWFRLLCSWSDCVSIGRALGGSVDVTGRMQTEPVRCVRAVESTLR